MFFLNTFDADFKKPEPRPSCSLVNYGIRSVRIEADDETANREETRQSFMASPAETLTAPHRQTAAALG
jgi:hypothetical protein